MSSYLKNAKKTNAQFRLFLLFAFNLTGLALLGCYSSTALPVIHETASSLTEAPITLPPTNTYNFEVLITNLEMTMPGPNTEGFKVPSKSDEQTFQSIVVSLLNDDATVAANRATNFHYELLSLFDQADSNAESYVLKEQPPIERGWGLYLFRKHNAQNIVVEAPHPVADEDTAKVALHLYRVLKAKALIIAGTHRDANRDGSSDPTHSTDSIFQTVHVTLFNFNGQPNTETMFLQIHGYATDLHPKAPPVVIGYNWKNDAPKNVLLSKIVASLESNGIAVGTCHESENHYQGLCGTLNVQGLATQGGIFIHLELDRSIRSNDLSFVRSLQQALIP